MNCQRVSLPLVATATACYRSDMPAARRSRTYESPLRAEQMDRTREKLLDAAIDLVAEAGSDELTVRRVAARAGVSVPTAYRHFPNPEALFEAIALAIHTRIGGPRIPDTLDEAPAWSRVIYKNFETNDRLMRAQLNTPAGRRLRARNQKARAPLFVELAKRSFPDASPAAHVRIAALQSLLVTVSGWVSLHDNYGVDGDEVGAIAAWAIETLLAELRRNPHALDFPALGTHATPAVAETPPPRRQRTRKKA